MSKSASEDTDLYEKHGINPKFDAPYTYSTANSYYKKGNYPPDWGRRREAVWERQRYHCGRCGVYKGDVPKSEVHHLVHLENNGSNELSNLVGLCINCHALMHPESAVVSGQYWEASLFPDTEADDRVAVIRSAIDNEELNQDFRNLENESDPDRNQHAVTKKSVSTSAGAAKRAADDLHGLLLAYGYVPRTGPYHAFKVNTKLAGIKGLVTFWSPDIAVDADATVTEADPETTGDAADYLFSPDGTQADISISEGNGHLINERIEMPGRSSQTERAYTVTPPPLTRSSAASYAFATVFYILTRGFIPGVLLTHFVPQYLPMTQWWLTVTLYSLLAGFIYFVFRAIFRH